MSGSDQGTDARPGCVALAPRRCALRERSFWRLLYESAARANEFLSLDVEDLDLSNKTRRCHEQGRRHRVGVLADERRSYSHGLDTPPSVHWNATPAPTPRLLPAILPNMSQPVDVAERPVG